METRTPEQLPRPIAKRHGSPPSATRCLLSRCGDKTQHCEAVEVQVRFIMRSRIRAQVGSVLHLELFAM